MKFLIILGIIGIVLFSLIVLFAIVCALLLDYQDYKADRDGTPSVDEMLRDKGVTGLTSSGHYITKDGEIRGVWHK